MPPPASPPAVDHTLIFRTIGSIRTLESKKKEVNRVYDDRLRRLQQVVESLTNVALGQPALPLGDTKESIAPELLALIDNPTRGL
jgi:hypothetical protein